MKFLLDEITPYDGYYNNYPKYYQGIRMALTALSRINEVPDVTDVERRELMGRCYFLVGYLLLSADVAVRDLCPLFRKRP